MEHLCQKFLVYSYVIMVKLYLQLLEIISKIWIPYHLAAAGCRYNVADDPDHLAAHVEHGPPGVAWVNGGVRLGTFMAANVGIKQTVEKTRCGHHQKGKLFGPAPR